MVEVRSRSLPAAIESSNVYTNTISENTVTTGNNATEHDTSQKRPLNTLSESQILFPDTTEGIILDYSEASETPSSNIYALETAKGLVVIDIGNEQAFPRYVANLEKRGRSPEEIEAIIVTDGHIDHYQSLKELKKPNSKPTVYFSEYGIESAMTKDPGPNAAFVYGFEENPYPLPIDLVDYQIKDGDVLDFGDYTMRVIRTDGHSVGNISLLVKGVHNNICFLAAADHAFGGMSDRIGSSIPKWEKAFKREETYPYTHIVAGHYPFTSGPINRSDFKKEKQHFCETIVHMQNGLDNGWPVYK